MEEPCEEPWRSTEIAQAIIQERRKSNMPAERRPTFHLAPQSGWLNDPNGPLLHKGTYHLFYQHVPDSSEWQWGLVWGHAKSQDLVTWQHLPVALEPTPGGLDRHGCFSGCATLGLDGAPSLLYTGVVRKQPHEVEPGVSPQHESQLIAVAADPDDPDLTSWRKLPGAFLPQPPPEMDLTGWRDPFVLERPGADSPWWVVMVGAGVRGKCGTALVCRSRDLTQGWEYVGPLCESPASFMWECPVMAKLNNAPPAPSSAPSSGPASATNGNGHTAQQQLPPQQLVERHLLAVSPDYCVNMVQCYLGAYSEGRFDLEAAAGPFPLDLGDIMYAPNLLTDKQGRTVLWAWMQEKQHLRPPGTYSSSCCLCVPRVLYLSPDGSRLCQQPLPELQQLRQPQGSWAAGRSGHDGAALRPREPLQLLAGGLEADGGSGSSSGIDLELEVARGAADSLVLLLHAFQGVPGAGAAVSYCWHTNTLQVINSTDLATLEAVSALPLPPRPHYRQPGPDPLQVAAAEAAAAGPGVPARCGGTLPGSAASDTASSSSATSSSDGDAATIKLRVLLDGSCLEVFTGCGQALGTRVYRGDEPPLQPHQPPQHSDAGAAAGRGPSAANAAASDAAAAAAAVGWEELFGPAAAAAAGPDGMGAGGECLGAPRAGGHIELISFGAGPAKLLRGAAWHMRSMWQQQQQDEAHAAAAAAAVLPDPAAATAVCAAGEAVLAGLVAAEVATVAAAAAAATIAAPAVLPVGELTVDVAAAGGGVGGAGADLLPLSPSTPTPVQVEAA